jgi:integrase
VTLLPSVKVNQAVERLTAASIWVETGHVFTTESGAAVDPRNALWAISTAAKASGMTGVGLHTLRHSFATHMLEAGVPLHTVSELLGYSSVAVTGDVYGHVSTAGARPAVERLSAAMGWCDCMPLLHPLLHFGLQTRQKPLPISRKRPLTCALCQSG